MNTFSIKLNKRQIKILFDKFYEMKILLPANGEHILLRAKTEDSEILVYTTGSTVIRSSNIRDDVKKLKELLNIKDYDAIGSDEVGTGDLFGPIVVCSAYVSVEDIPYLEELNIRDSKKIKDEKVVELAKKVAGKITHSIIMLTPKEYNKLVSEGNNLNKIKALLHNQSYLKTLPKLENKSVTIIQDKFCSKENYFNYLKDEKFIEHDILFYEKAESVHLSVAVAAIIARCAFLGELKKYEEELGISIPRGANEKSTKMLVALIQRFGKEIMPNYVKKNFKNIERALSSKYLKK